ncbi:MAG: T9SS type A sorting domain-containing protein [Bacteroidales bacterium]|nr:T9SS type A sorting domain-containing protein [Bacteroidales bacterium]
MKIHQAGIVNRYICFVLFFSLPLISVAKGEIKLNGIYKGENLYVENPYSLSGVGFCVAEVLVNGHTTTDEIHSSFFEIDLSVYGFKYGELINISIIHRDGCVPRILNKEVITPNSTFKTQYIVADKNGLLRWATTGEHGVLPFIVEQYRWNKWIRIGSIKGKGSNKLNKYSFAIDFHSGKNKFRVKQIGSNGKARYSKSVEYINNIPEVSFVPGNGGKVSEKIFFSASTRYEIYDYYGKLVKTGNSEEIKLSSLKSGSYFLNYDNKTETFIKK